MPCPCPLWVHSERLSVRIRMIVQEQCWLSLIVLVSISCQNSAESKTPSFRNARSSCECVGVKKNFGSKRKQTFNSRTCWQTVVQFYVQLLINTWELRQGWDAITCISQVFAGIAWSIQWLEPLSPCCQIGEKVICCSCNNLDLWWLGSIAADRTNTTLWHVANGKLSSQNQDQSNPTWISA